MKPRAKETCKAIHFVLDRDIVRSKVDVSKSTAVHFLADRSRSVSAACTQTPKLRTDSSEARLGEKDVCHLVQQGEGEMSAS